MKRISQKRRLMVVKYQNQRDVDRLDTCLKTIISKSCLAARSGLFFPRISLAVMQCECGATTTSRFIPSKPASRSTLRRRMWHENPQVCL